MNMAPRHRERSIVIPAEAGSAISIRGILTVGLFLTIVCPAKAKYNGGTGEPSDPYQIATAADLIALGETPGDYDKHFILTADIDLDPHSPGERSSVRLSLRRTRIHGKTTFRGPHSPGSLMVTAAQFHI